MRAHATDYVLFALGGTGSKVAEAFVDLMTLGIPMARHDGQLRASRHGGDRFTIARIDTDKECRSSQLDDAIQRYEALRAHAPNDGGLWGADIINAHTIHPLEALEGREREETLESYLATRDSDGEASRLLEAFYTPADLATPLHQGFFQCPDIGAAVVGSIADLAKADPPSPLIQMMEGFRARDVRIFIVGSLFGGTGAAGVPVVAKALNNLAQEWGVEDKWHLGACLVGPYFLPPDPPVDQIEWGEGWKPGGVEPFDSFLARKGLSEDQYLDQVVERQEKSGSVALKKKETIRQVARGYYAKREEIVGRAFDSWIYYESRGRSLFNRLYLLGLENPTDYNRVTFRGQPIAWANGGRKQESPLHVVELAAASAAQHFFAFDGDGDDVYILGSVHSTGQDGDTLAWDDLGSSKTFDFGRSMITALVGYNWLRFTWVEHLTDHRRLAQATEFKTMHRLLDAETYPAFHEILGKISSAVGKSLLDLRTALAWETTHVGPMQAWSERGESFGEEGVIRQVTPKFEFPGDRSIEIGLQELAQLSPAKTIVSREQAGEAAIEYLREVWAEIYRRVETTGSPGDE